MKKILVLLLVIAILVVTGFGYTYFNRIDTKLPSSLKKCEIIGVKTQYVKEGFIYFKNGPPDSGEYVYADFALYKRDLETGGWQVKPDLNRNGSLYNMSLTWINQGKYLDGSPIQCVSLQSDDQLPAGFRQFITAHPLLFNKAEKETKIAG